MLIRISLIIALITALAVGILNFVMVKEKIGTLITERNDWHGKYDTTYAELTTTKQTLDKTQSDLKQTQETLATTTTERDKAVADAAAQTKKATELNDKLSKTTTERDEARQELAAFRATGVTPEQILTLNQDIKQAKQALEVAIEENRILDRNLKKKIAELAKYTDPEYIGPSLPATLKGKILVADPKWDFVVLDVGEDQGALADGELLVSRNGKLVAKVRIHSVQKDRCIANVVPSWKLGEVMEGDLVIPAHPAS
jgi:multidrug efflux pump subunit AcrA (membrane-fusion protein)